MKKRGVFLFFISFLLSIWFVSAFSFSDLFGEITGYATDETCTDSDNGKDYFQRGEMKFGIVTYQDFCISNYSLGEPSDESKKVISCNASDCYLIEEFCYLGKGRWEAYKCPNGCKEGKCSDEPVPFNKGSCIDSDKGKDYFTKGTVNDARETPNIQDDYCLDEHNLTEFWCSENGYSSSIYLCPNKCIDGRCIQDTALEPEYNYFFNDYTTLVQNGNSNEKLDIFFIPLNISTEVFDNAISNMLYDTGIAVNNSCGDIYSRGLFETEPFKSNKDRFNIVVSNKELNFNFFNCVYEGYTPGLRSNPNLNCNLDLIKENIPFNPEVIVIVGKDFQTSAGGGLVMMGDPSADSSEPQNYSYSFVHEFGHAFGGLTDEYPSANEYNCNDKERGCYYSYLPDPCVDSENITECVFNLEKNLEITPNEDTLGCPKWCESYNETLLQELSSEFKEITNFEDCVISGGMWFKQKHPWFESNCVPTQFI